MTDMEITNELLAAYAEGNVSRKEREAVSQYLAANPDKMESVMFAMEYINNLGSMLDDIESETSKTINHNHTIIDRNASVLPMQAMAAQNTIDNQCVIKCEGIALRHFGIEVTDEALTSESEQEGWLHPEGTALHNIGRLAGRRGLSVSHRYHSTLEEIQEELSASNIVIVAVDGNELIGDYATEQQKDIEIGLTPNHVVVINKLSEDSVTLTDSASPLQQDTYPMSQFLDAWEDSSNYMIVISNCDEYIPHPIKLDDVEVEDELIELREAIAENAHEVWAETRRNEGWTYGAVRDDATKQHPDMLPYNRLPESEKEYDRLMAMNTIKLLKKLGWKLSKNR